MCDADLCCSCRVFAASEVHARLADCAGYGWQIGWYFQMAWQVFFALDTRASLWACLFLLLGAFAGFAITLLNLYRRALSLAALPSMLLACNPAWPALPAVLSRRGSECNGDCSVNRVVYGAQSVRGNPGCAALRSSKTNADLSPGTHPA